jgi:uncharacterized phage protein (TIGR02218 family)
MKTISVALQAHLDQPQTTLCTAWKITRRDGVVLGYTDHDQDLSLDADGAGLLTYTAASGYSRSAIAAHLGLTLDNLDLEGLLDADAITEADLAMGVYDGATVLIFQVNWADLSQGILKLHRGYLGTTTWHRVTYTAQLQGLMQAYAQPIGEIYTPDCRADLGDSRCQVALAPAAWQATHAYAVGDRVVALSGAQPLRHFRCTTAGTSGGSEPAWQTTVGSATADASVTWTTLLAFTVAATVETVPAASSGEPGPRTFTTTADLSSLDPADGTEGWFAGGGVTWLTGANAGSTWEVKRFTPATSTLTLFLVPPHVIQAGDTCTLTVGCPKRREVCRDRFQNLLHFRGEPFVPGLNKALAYPAPGGH